MNMLYAMICVGMVGLFTGLLAGFSTGWSLGAEAMRAKLRDSVVRQARTFVEFLDSLRHGVAPHLLEPLDDTRRELRAMLEDFDEPGEGT